MRITRLSPGSLCSGRVTRRQDFCAPDRFRLKRHAALIWRQILLVTLVLGVSAAPFYAQRGGGGGHGTGGRGGGVFYPPVYPRPGMNPTMQPFPDIPPLPRPTVADDDKCFPWKISEARAATVSVSRLQVPSKARREFGKACDALNKNKFDEAEQHARKAIEKFQDYSAAWVTLGLSLEGQQKPQAAAAACSHAVTLDATYLPSYLCKAEFALRNRDWKQVLNLADLAEGLNPDGDAYVYYYRAAAYFHTDNLAEARKCALRAEEIDTHHSEPYIYFLTAQIYAQQGETENAITQLRQLLKHHSDPQHEDQARQYLAELESQQSTK
jgi:Tetratricopeptide repeat